MFWRLLKLILILPGTVLVIVPAAIHISRMNLPMPGIFFSGLA